MTINTEPPTVPTVPVSEPVEPASAPAATEWEAVTLNTDPHVAIQIAPESLVDPYEVHASTAAQLSAEIAEAQQEMLAEDVAWRDYWWDTLSQLVCGDFTDEVTGAGTAGSIALGLFGLDMPLDVRDLGANLYDWEWSWEHAGETTLNLVAFLPVVGVFKYGDEAAELAQGAKKLDDLPTGAVKHDELPTGQVPTLPVDGPHVFDEARVGHIFRDAPGHLPDTPVNRDLLKAVADDPSTTLGVDKWGNTWSARNLDDGTQVWVQTRGGQIVNGGLNETPRAFNPETGLSASGVQ